MDVHRLNSTTPLKSKFLSGHIYYTNITANSSRLRFDNVVVKSTSSTENETLNGELTFKLGTIN
ncbi:MAG: hypothetical protein HUK00_07380 [Bacteroidaceae bacterium]|nr:hypothetical protein [Bacteroidaceae bacterium]